MRTKNEQINKRLLYFSYNYGYKHKQTTMYIIYNWIFNITKYWLRISIDSQSLNNLSKRILFLMVLITQLLNSNWVHVQIRVQTMQHLLLDCYSIIFKKIIKKSTDVVLLKVRPRRRDIALVANLWCRSNNGPMENFATRLQKK